MRTAILAPVLLAGTLVLAGCGDTRLDRAVSGGGIGAATGAVGSAVIGGPMLGWSLVGGAAGAAIGAVTDKDKINLGTPLWR
jgi:hypothetical protein